MDDLWGSPHTQVVQDSHCYMRPGWHFDFGYWFDGIEEDALHEKSCIQVLRILITKADTEIDELEKDLVTLHNELAWDEYEDWSEICSNALTEKINYLDISIKTLRNENDIQINLLMHRESADRLHDIVKTLLKNYGQEKVEQAETHGVTVIYSHSDSPQISAELLEKTPSPNTSDDAEIIAKEEIGESCNHIEDSSGVLTSSQKCQENITDDLVPDKPANVVCPIEEQLDNAVCSIEELLSDVKYSIGDLLLNENFVPGPHYLRSEESGKELSLKSLDIESTGLREAKELANDNGVVDSLSLTSAIMERHNLEMVKIEPAGAVQDYTKSAFTSPISHQPISAVKIEEVENMSSLYLGDVPILNSAKIACIGENLKSTFTLSKYSSPITHTVATGKLAKMKNLCNSDLRPSGYKTNTFTPVRLEKNVETDLEQKLRDFASSVACKQSLKGSSRRISKSLLMLKGQKKVGEGGLLNLQDNRGTNRARLQPKEKDDEDVPTDDELISNIPHKIARQKTIKPLESKPNRVGILKTSYITMDKLSISSASTSKAKMQTSESSKASSLVSFLSGKLTKRIVKRRPWETEEQTSDDPLKDQNPPKKRKRSSSPSVGTITSSQETENSYESSCDDSGTEILVSSSDLMDLKMGDLRAIAKEQKLLHYYKLKKSDLVKQLISRLGFSR